MSYYDEFIPLNSSTSDHDLLITILNKINNIELNYKSAYISTKYIENAGTLIVQKGENDVNTTT